LIVGLVMLAVMTLLVVSMIKTSVVELKIGGANQIAQQNFATAERVINGFIDINNGRFASNYLSLPSGSGGPATPPSGTPAYSTTSHVYAVTGLDFHTAGATLQVRQIQCSPPSRKPIGVSIGAFEHVHFDVRSTVTGKLGGSTSVHQGIRSIVPAGSC
jgi:hypothetical protein